MPLLSNLSTPVLYSSNTCLPEKPRIVNFLPCRFLIPLYSTFKESIATLQSSVSTKIKESVSFSFNILPPSFLSISLKSVWLPQPLKSFYTVLEKALSEKTPGMFKEKVESSVCQTELGHSEGELFPRGVIFPSNSCYEPYIISKELHSFGVQTNAHTHTHWQTHTKTCTLS